MQPKRKRTTIGFVVIVFSITLFWVWYKTGKGTEGSTIQYRAAQVQRGDLHLSIIATGVVQPENRVEIKPPISGRAEEVLTKEGDNVKQGQTLAWMSSNERAALLDAAQAKGPAQVQHWKELYKPIPVLAPITGMVISRKVEPGQSFSNTDSILAMSDRLTIKAQVDETDLALIQLKQTATVALDAYPNQVMPAWVEKIAYDAKTVNNITTYTVTVLLLRNPSYLRSGMTANVTFQIAERKGTLFIPANSLKTQSGKTQAWVTANPHQESDKLKSSAVAREIKMGISEGLRVEVLEGLNEGEWVLETLFKAGAVAQKQNSPFSPMGGGSPRRGH